MIIGEDGGMSAKRQKPGSWAFRKEGRLRGDQKITTLTVKEESVLRQN